MGLGNLGPMELFIILVIVLVLFGAKRVPEIGASIGKGIREFKKNMNDTASELRNSVESTEPQRSSLGAGPATPVRQDEEARPEPKRLM